MEIYSIFMYWKSEYCPSANTMETIKRIKIPMAFLQGLKRQFKISGEH